MSGTTVAEIGMMMSVRQIWEPFVRRVPENTISRAKDSRNSGATSISVAVAKRHDNNNVQSHGKYHAQAQR